MIKKRDSAISKDRKSAPDAFIYDVQAVAAIQALQRGDASPEQQIFALKWIIENAATYYEIGYHGEKTHDSAFSSGRRFVGGVIVKLSKLDLGALKKALGDHV